MDNMDMEDMDFCMKDMKSMGDILCRPSAHASRRATHNANAVMGHTSRVKTSTPHHLHTRSLTMTVNASPVQASTLRHLHTRYLTMTVSASHVQTSTPRHLHTRSLTSLDTILLHAMFVSSL